MSNLHSQYEIGKEYNIPVIEQLGSPLPMNSMETVTIDWLGFKGDLPLLAYWAKDEEIVSPNLPIHVHIDWRFVEEEEYQKLCERLTTTYRWQHVMLTPQRQFRPYVRPTIKAMRCLRDPPAFPETCNLALEQKYACETLKNGRCPHRAVAREAMLLTDDGVLVCPAHGLRWKMTTGELVPTLLYTKQEFTDHAK